MLLPYVGVIGVAGIVGVVRVRIAGVAGAPVAQAPPAWPVGAHPPPSVYRWSPSLSHVWGGTDVGAEEAGAGKVRVPRQLHKQVNQ